MPFKKVFYLVFWGTFTFSITCFLTDINRVSKKLILGWLKVIYQVNFPKVLDTYQPWCVKSVQRAAFLKVRWMCLRSYCGLFQLLYDLCLITLLLPVHMDHLQLYGSNARVWFDKRLGERVEEPDYHICMCFFEVERIPLKSIVENSELCNLGVLIAWKLHDAHKSKDCHKYAHWECEKSANVRLISSFTLIAYRDRLTICVQWDEPIDKGGRWHFLFI